MTQKKLLVVSTGGDCPGINAVIRALVKSAQQDPSWLILGSYEGYNGLMSEPPHLLELRSEDVAGIHVKGGTILQTTNKQDPLHFPVQQADKSVVYEDVTPQLVARLKSLKIDTVVAIGGDGTQRVSLRLAEQGIKVVGVPKTIDNDLSATQYTFGFQTAVQTAVDCFDRLVSTAESHNRTMIMEVMGRDAGWIALHTAIGGGAEVCLIPEIPYDITYVKEAIEARYTNGHGFANIVIAEGARSLTASTSSTPEHRSVAYALAQELRSTGLEIEIRETVLGHIQRGGSPIAFDRILATQFGVKAFEMAQKERTGYMVSFSGSSIEEVSLREAASAYRYVDPADYLIEVARKTGISFGTQS